MGNSSQQSPQVVQPIDQINKQANAQKPLGQKKQSLNQQKIKQLDYSLVKKIQPNLSQPSKVSFPKRTKQKQQKIVFEKQIQKQKVQLTKRQTNGKSQLCHTLISSNHRRTLFDNNDFIEQILSKLSRQQLSLNRVQFQNVVWSVLQKCRQKFIQKLKNGQIYPIFSHEKETFKKDEFVFQTAIKLRILNKMTIFENVQGDITNFQIHVNKGIETEGGTLIGELMGKTSIWRSLMISRQDQQEKILQMLMKEGMNQKQLSQIKQMLHKN